MKIFKRLGKWYLNQSSKTYVWLPTGTFPVNKF